MTIDLSITINKGDPFSVSLHWEHLDLPRKGDFINIYDCNYYEDTPNDILRRIPDHEFEYAEFEVEGVVWYNNKKIILLRYNCQIYNRYLRGKITRKEYIKLENEQWDKYEPPSNPGI
jgi:hypothetical protein